MTGIAVYAAINAVSGALSQDGISKGRQGNGFKFRGIDEVMNALAPLLVKHKLIIAPRILERECTERVAKSGGALFYITVAAEFDFISAEDGSKLTVRTYGEAMDSGDKATNKAMAIAYKYAAFQTFCIPTEGSGDTDADATTHEVQAKPSLSQPKSKEPTPQAGKPTDDSLAKVNAPSKAAGSVTPASPRKTAADVPAVAPTKHPVPGQGQFAPTVKPQSASMAKIMINWLETKRYAVEKEVTPLETVQTQFGDWLMEARATWHEMEPVDQRRVKQAKDKLAGVLGVDPQTGELIEREAAE